MIGFAVGILVLVLVVVFTGMIRSWRRRLMAQHDLAAPEVGEASSPPSQTVPADAVRVRADVLGTYVATTFAGRPLERVVAHGLGFRARANVQITDTGLRMDRAGSLPMFVPRASLAGAGSATWTIDRAVERGGLTVVGWRMESTAGPVEVESAFRFDQADGDAVVAAVNDLVEVK